jgi:hypothetical protein
MHNTFQIPTNKITDVTTLDKALLKMSVFLRQVGSCSVHYKLQCTLQAAVYITSSMPPGCFKQPNDFLNKNSEITS